MAPRRSLRRLTKRSPSSDGFSEAFGDKDHRAILDQLRDVPLSELDIFKAGGSKSSEDTAPVAQPAPRRSLRAKTVVPQVKTEEKSEGRKGRNAPAARTVSSTPSTPQEGRSSARVTRQSASGPSTSTRGARAPASKASSKPVASTQKKRPRSVKDEVKEEDVALVEEKPDGKAGKGDKGEQRGEDWEISSSTGFGRGRSRSATRSTRRNAGVVDGMAELQFTPKEALEKLAEDLSTSDDSTLLSSRTAFPKSRSKQKLFLSSLPGCQMFEDTSVVEYAIRLCMAHEVSLLHYGKLIRARVEEDVVRREEPSKRGGRKPVGAKPGDADHRLVYKGPSSEDWKNTLSDSACKDQVPCLESLRVVCSLLVGLFPNLEVLEGEDFQARALCVELYEASDYTVTLLSFYRALCFAVEAIVAIPDVSGSVADAGVICNCYEIMTRWMSNRLASELVLLRSPVESDGKSSSSSSAYGHATNFCKARSLFIIQATNQSHCEGVPEDGSVLCPDELSEFPSERVCDCSRLRLSALLRIGLRYLDGQKSSSEKLGSQFSPVVMELYRRLLAVHILGQDESRRGLIEWDAFESEITLAVSYFSQSTFVWDSLVPSIAKKIRSSHFCFGVIGVFVHYDSFLRELLSSVNTEARNSVFSGMIGSAFATYAKSPLRQWNGSGVDDLAPEAVFAAFFKLSVVLREIVSGSDHSVRTAFLQSVDVLLQEVDKFDRKQAVPGKDVEEADPSPLPRSPSPNVRISENVNQADAIETAAHAAKVRARCFAAKLFGFFCKSFQDGSWDPDHSCVLETILESLKSRRAVALMYQRLDSLQRNLDPGTVGVSGDSERQLLSVDECNHFMYVREAVRHRMISSAKSRMQPGDSDGSERGLGSKSRSVGQSRSAVSAKFPNLAVISCARAAVGRPAGFEPLECQVDLLGSLQQFATEAGIELRSRFDRDSNAPAKFIRLKKNKYVGVARPKMNQPDKCSCIRGGNNKQAPEYGTSSRVACSNDLCSNRLLRFECDPSKCPAGDTCQNQRMQKMQYAKVERVDLGKRGSGLSAVEDIPVGSLIGEYQGEVIDEAEFKRRGKEYVGERHFYFMSLTPKLFIDASRYSQVTRFINHCCEPNAETQKWTAGREPRVGIFAKRTIKKGEEITFDYGTKQAKTASERPVKCLCGASNCRGFLIKAAEKRDSHGSDVASSDAAGKGNVEEDRRERKKAESRRLLFWAAELSDTLRAVKSRPPPQNYGDDNPRVRAWVHRLEGKELRSRIPRKHDTSERRSPAKHVVDAVGEHAVKTKNFEVGGTSSQKSRRDASPKIPAPRIGAKPIVKPSSRARSFALPSFMGARREKNRMAGGNRAPVVRNRRVDKAARVRVGDDKASPECDDYSISSPTVPVEDDCIFMDSFELGEAAETRDKFAETGLIARARRNDYVGLGAWGERSVPSPGAHEFAHHPQTLRGVSSFSGRWEDSRPAKQRRPNDDVYAAPAMPQEGSVNRDVLDGVGRPFDHQLGFPDTRVRNEFRGDDVHCPRPGDRRSPACERVSHEQHLGTQRMGTSDLGASGLGGDRSAANGDHALYEGPSMRIRSPPRTFGQPRWSVEGEDQRSRRPRSTNTPMSLEAEERKIGSSHAQAGKGSVAVGTRRFSGAQSPVRTGFRGDVGSRYRSSTDGESFGARGLDTQPSRRAADPRQVLSRRSK